MNKTNMRDKLANAKQIPNLPKQAHRLVQAFNNPNLGISDLVKIVSEHPTITVRLIALANSAWASPHFPVNSLERACINLGLTIVRSVSIALALISPFNTSLCPAFNIQRFWITSKLVADAAVQLALLRTDPPQQAFVQTLHTSGLLHNLGLICLAHALPQETQNALLSLNTQPDWTVNQALYAQLQTDYCEVGGWFAQTWGLPNELVTVIKQHRNPDYQDDLWPLVALVGDAAVIVSSLLNEQTELVDVGFSAQLGLSNNDRQQVFEQLTPMYQEATELAKMLF